MGFARRLILASASPRRRQLLEQMGLEFETWPPVGVESPPGEKEEPWRYVLRNAERKAVEGSRKNSDALVLSADTVVVINGEILGKPRDAEEARGMLRKLSGGSHQVHTGISLAFQGQTVISDVVTTKVFFRELSSKEIEDYIASGEPLDKAGAYGIQGRGALLVDRLEGCYYNVVGLPLSRTWVLLNEAMARLAVRSGGAKC
ncbi:MAG: Maf family protein [Candidatus Zipacnadales bacterium]